MLFRSVLFTSGTRDRSHQSPILKDFDAVDSLRVYRGQNVAAHYLARSSEFVSVSVRRGVPLMCIRETICTDSMFP